MLQVVLDVEIEKNIYSHCNTILSSTSFALINKTIYNIVLHTNKYKYLVENRIEALGCYEKYLLLLFNLDDKEDFLTTKSFLYKSLN